ncbi:unnamed protein product [marine sediment metagenome]|uniref:Uncharacterized protein n=1 Tax=marine sediment metagenome TaxID=412755 RepID=X1RF24_9ZZZZ
MTRDIMNGSGYFFKGNQITFLKLPAHMIRVPQTYLKLMPEKCHVD